MKTVEYIKKKKLWHYLMKLFLQVRFPWRNLRKWFNSLWNSRIWTVHWTRYRISPGVSTWIMMAGLTSMSSWRHLESSIASENSPRSSNKISSPSVHWIASWLWRTVAFLWGPKDEYQTWMISKNTGLKQDNQCLHTELANYLVLEFFFWYILVAWNQILLCF